MAIGGIGTQGKKPARQWAVIIGPGLAEPKVIEVGQALGAREIAGAAILVLFPDEASARTYIGTITPY